MAPMAKAKVSQLTYADLQALPDDRNRYELIDGELLVSAAPNTAHQRAVAALYRLLFSTAPAGFEVFFVPYDWYVDDRNVYEPDLLVAASDDLTDRYLPHPPVLAVEVLSPSTRRTDLVRKRAAYERAGLPHYWLVDPVVPSLTVLERVGGRLVEVLAVKDDEVVELARPFPISLSPASVARP